MIWQMLYNIYIEWGKSPNRQPPKPTNQENTMTAKVKTPNYTDEMVATLQEGYDPKADEAERKATVIALGKTVGKPVRSVIAKLVKMGVYVKPERKTKNGKAIVKKEELADKIGNALGMKEADVTSLTKANKTALETLVNFIEN